MIVWGGSAIGVAILGDGARYDPATDAWSALPVSPLAPRAAHSAVWTGTEMIVWGGTDGVSAYGDGARFDPATNTWTYVQATTVLAPRSHHSAVWTGSEMIVWGGAHANQLFGDGARYDPSSGSWTATNQVGALGPRMDHVAIWTGTEMDVLGPYAPSATPSLRYNPATDAWSPTGNVLTGRRQCRLGRTGDLLRRLHKRHADLLTRRALGSPWRGSMVHPGPRCSRSSSATTMRGGHRQGDSERPSRRRARHRIRRRLGTTSSALAWARISPRSSSTISRPLLSARPHGRSGQESAGASKSGGSCWPASRLAPVGSHERHPAQGIVPRESLEVLPQPNLIVEVVLDARNVANRSRVVPAATEPLADATPEVTRTIVRIA
jgi:hypothetical protein